MARDHFLSVRESKYKAHQYLLLEDHRLWHVEVTSLLLNFGIFPSSFLDGSAQFEEVVERDHILREESRPLNHLRANVVKEGLGFPSP